MLWVSPLLGLAVDKLRGGNGQGGLVRAGFVRGLGLG